MTRLQLHINIHYYLALLIAFSLPFAILTPVFMALLLLNWILEGDFSNKFKTIANNKLALLFIAFYGLHLLGMLYSKNLNSGGFDVQVKLSIIICPLILGSRPFLSKKANDVFYAFFVGCLFSCLFLLTKAGYNYLFTGGNTFFYSSFSILLHPSYMAIYLNLTISWLLIGLINNKFKTTTFSNTFAIICVAFFSFINVLLSSKMGLISMVFVFTGFIIHYVISRKKYIFGLIGFALLLGSITTIVAFVPTVSNRITSAIDAITNPVVDNTQLESTAVRILVWKAAVSTISQNLLLGTGTGDAKDELLVEYETQGMKGALEHKLNTHNQFLETTVTLGLIGLSLLLLNLFVPLYDAFKHANYLYICFLLLIIINFIPEVMLSTQAGVMFYAFFNSLLCFSNLNSSINKS